MSAKIRHVLAGWLTEWIVRFLVKTKISPNTLTLIGLALNIAVAWVLAKGYFLAGGLLSLFSGWFDLLDGALARSSKRTTRFGALLDSTLDRFSEAVLFLGLLIFYSGQNKPLEVLLIYATIVGSIMVSYVRARAEGLGLKSEVGIFTRSERVILLALGLILAQFWPKSLQAVLWILAVGTNLTALQRLLHGWKQTRADKPRN